MGGCIVMNYLIRCSRCGKKNNVSEENLEKKLKCGHCKEVFSGNESVLELSDNNFEKIINQGNNILVLYSDTCPYCVGVKNSFRTLSNQFKNVKFSQINSGYNPKAVGKFQIRGVPSIFLIKNGKIMENIPGAVDESQLRNIINNIFI